MTPARIAELRALADAATPRPWIVHVDSTSEPTVAYEEVTSADGRDTRTTVVARDTTPADGRFIIAARSAIPELLDAIDEAGRLVAYHRERDLKFENAIERVRHLAKPFVGGSEVSDPYCAAMEDVLAALEGKTE